MDERRANEIYYEIDKSHGMPAGFVPGVTEAVERLARQEARIAELEAERDGLLTAARKVDAARRLPQGDADPALTHWRALVETLDGLSSAIQKMNDE